VLRSIRENGDMNIEVKTQARTPTKEEMIARAEAMLPALRERAADAEKNRRLSDETVAEFRAAGFPKILQAKRFGGYELAPDTAVEVIRTISTACGSSGWVTNLFVVHTWQASLFPIEAQEEYWDGGDDKLCSTASFFTQASMEEVDGGVRLSGRWKFSSGCDFADWFIIMKPSATCFDWMLIPRKDITFIDDWLVSGLCATGSKDIVLDNVFVPAHRRLSIMDIAAGNTPGGNALGIPMARLPFGWPAIWGIPAALIGMAEGMAAAVQKTLVGKKALFTGEVQVERVANQIKLTECLTDIHAATLIMRNRMAELNKWAEAGKPPTPLDALVSHRDAAYVARLIGQVAHKLTLMAGATSVYLANPIQRFQRDINVGVTHVSLVWEDAAENFGRCIWELPPKPRR
jgi:3-hydroxy-9,10-secoandrosta-1,3,5(10)-triene-9,17-dione monooxygenase